MRISPTQKRVGTAAILFGAVALWFIINDDEPRHHMTSLASTGESQVSAASSLDKFLTVGTERQLAAETPAFGRPIDCRSAQSGRRLTEGRVQFLVKEDDHLYSATLQEARLPDADCLVWIACPGHVPRLVGLSGTQTEQETVWLAPAASLDISIDRPPGDGEVVVAELRARGVHSKFDRVVPAELLGFWIGGASSPRVSFSRAYSLARSLGTDVKSASSAANTRVALASAGVRKEIAAGSASWSGLPGGRYTWAVISPHHVEYEPPPVYDSTKTSASDLESGPFDLVPLRHTKLRGRLRPLASVQGRLPARGSSFPEVRLLRQQFAAETTARGFHSHVQAGTAHPDEQGVFIFRRVRHGRHVLTCTWKVGAEIWQLSRRLDLEPGEHRDLGTLWPDGSVSSPVFTCRVEASEPLPHQGDDHSVAVRFFPVNHGGSDYAFEPGEFDVRLGEAFQIVGLHNERWRLVASPRKRWELPGWKISSFARVSGREGNGIVFGAEDAQDSWDLIFQAQKTTGRVLFIREPAVPLTRASLHLGAVSASGSKPLVAEGRAADRNGLSGWEFELDVPAGKYLLVARGLTAGGDSLSAHSLWDSASSIDLHLEPSGTLSLSVVDTDRRPVAGWLVALAPADCPGMILSGVDATTDSQGRVTVPGLPLGLPLVGRMGLSGNVTLDSQLEDAQMTATGPRAVIGTGN